MVVDAPEALPIPTAAEDEARVDPIVASLANLIGSLAASDSLKSPRRFETAMAVAQTVGGLLDEPSLTRVLCLRALCAPPNPRSVLAEVKRHAGTLSAPDRAAAMRSLAELLGDDAPQSVQALSPDVAAALAVPLPDNLRRVGATLGETFGHFAGRAMRLVRSEPEIVTSARDFAIELGEVQLLTAVAEAHSRRLSVASASWSASVW